VQQIKTVETVEAAERQKREAVIAAEGKAEQLYVTQKRGVDAQVYQVKEDAEARKAAADADAEAVTKKATAEANAEKAKAAGEQARAMVPVQVDRAKVEIDKDRIETVVRPELEAREQHGKVAQEFELDKLRITQEAGVRIETARATAQVVGKIDAHVFGTPQNVEEMTAAYFGGHKIMQTLDGFREAGGSGIVDAFAKVAEETITRVLAGKQEKEKEEDPALPPVPPQPKKPESRLPKG
jgi:hypothetical protein